MKEKLPVNSMLFLFVFLIGFVAEAQNLKVNGKKIVNDKGQEVILRGIGLGGWMLQEPYMLQASSVAGTQHQIKEKIKALIGAEKTQQFYDAWLENYIQKVDVDSLKKWGFNSIRLPMHYNLYTLPVEEEPVAGQNTWLEKGFALTDRLLEWCKANQIYLILDLHAAPGGQGHDAAISDYDKTKPSLWESEANQQKTVALWRKLAERYAQEAWIGGYDLINEPNWGFENPQDANGCGEQGNAPLKNLYVQLTNAIREVDTNHLLIIEGNCWGNNHSGLLPFWDDNMVISFHKYWNYNDKNSIQGLLDLREKYNVPLWLGESGENSNSWHTGAIGLVEKYGIGWSWWTFKKNGLNTPLEIKMNDGFKKIIDYWGGGVKPSEAEAFAGLMELAENYKMSNAFFHKDFIDAMFRQVKTTTTLPFTSHTITANTVVFAADYDLGKNLYAYSDKDTSNYSVSTGTYTAWNNGWVYRNDGVDIQSNQDTVSNGYNVGWTNDGEWLQYTIEIPKAGLYNLKLRTATTGNDGKVSLTSNGLPVSKVVGVPNSGGYQNWVNTEIKQVYFNAGKNVLRVNVDKGGFNFNYIQFDGPKLVSDLQAELLNARTSSDGRSIELIFNQPLSKANSSKGFEVVSNQVKRKYGHVYLKDNQPQVLVLILQEPLKFGDFAYISYSGKAVKTANGDFLPAFSDVKVDVMVKDPFSVGIVPGKIQAESLVINEGVRLENSADIGGGKDLGYMDPTDFFTYDVDVKETGLYQIEYRHAGQDTTGKVNVYVLDYNRQFLIETVEFTKTGGWQTWNTISGKEFLLLEGRKSIKFEVVQGGFNLNWFNVKLLKLSPFAKFEVISATTDSIGSKIKLFLDKSISSSTVSKKGFNLLIDGNSAIIDSVSAEGQYLSFYTSSSILPSTIIKIGYSGKGTIQSTDGEKLRAFDYLLVKNEMDPSLIPLPIPGRIEAETFKVNKGFQFESTADAGGGQDAGWTDAGDYLDYLVKVDKAATYKVAVRVAGYANPGRLSLQLVDNGVITSLSSISFPSTNGWQNWQTFSSEIVLPAGRHMLRMLAETGSFNFNWMEFSMLTDSSNVMRLGEIKESASYSTPLLYPNPTPGSFTINQKVLGQKVEKIMITDRSGRIIKQFGPIDAESIQFNENLAKGVYFITLQGHDKKVIKRLIIQ